MPETANINPVDEARRIAPDAIESILNDHRAIFRRGVAAMERRDPQWKAIQVQMREWADERLRQMARYGWLPDELDQDRVWLEYRASTPPSNLIGKTSDDSGDRRIIARRERSIERKLDRVEREHGPLIRYGVGVAVWVDWIIEMDLPPEDKRELLEGALETATALRNAFGRLPT